MECVRREKATQFLRSKIPGCPKNPAAVKEYVFHQGPLTTPVVCIRLLNVSLLSKLDLTLSASSALVPLCAKSV